MLSQVCLISGSRNFGTQCADTLVIWLHGCVTEIYPAQWQRNTPLLFWLPWSPVWWLWLAFSDRGRLPDSPCHIWIQHPTSSPCCMKGHPSLVWPPCLHESLWVLSPWDRGSGWPHNGWCCSFYQKTPMLNV